MPSAEHEALVAMLSANPIVSVPTVAEQRAGYDAMMSMATLPDDVDVQPIRIPGPGGECDADWVRTPDCRDDHVVLYLHGGGYVIGNNVGYREFAGRVSRALRARVCVLNYRLAPEHPFPAAVEDATAAYRWLLAEGIAPGRITVSGDSAGGGLTFATLLALRDAGDPLPACGVTFSPWTDLEGTGDSAKPGAVDDPLVAADGLHAMAAHYASGALRNPLAAPLHAELAGLPPVQIQVGGREVLRDDSTRIAAKARAAGVEIDWFEGEGLVHVWPVLAPTAPESADALARMATFAERHWA